MFIPLQNMRSNLRQELALKQVVACCLPYLQCLGPLVLPVGHPMVVAG